MLTSAKLPHRVIQSQQSPVMRETVYDRTIAAMISLLLVLIAMSILLITLWVQFVETVENAPPMQKRTIVSGLNSAVVLRDGEFLESEIYISEESESDLNFLLDAVTSVDALDSASGTYEETIRNSVGGMPNTAIGGDSAEQVAHRRWFFEVEPPVNTSAYKRMLDHFGIELAAVFADGRIIYLRQLSGSSIVRRSSDLAAEKRYFTVWNNGALESIDRESFANAGVDTTGARLVQLLSPDLEQQLEKKALAFANREEADVNKTWFRFQSASSGFEVIVIRQLPK